MVRIANCYFQALYNMRNEQTDEAWYYFRIERPGKPVTKSTFTAAQLASAPEFTKRLLNVSNGGWYTGTAAQLIRLLELQMDDLKQVNTIDWIGYPRNTRPTFSTKSRSRKATSTSSTRRISSMSAH